MSTNDSLTVVFLVSQGATAYYNNALQIDGTLSLLNIKAVQHGQVVMLQV
jgi:hypothetical protein